MRIEWYFWYWSIAHAKSPPIICQWRNESNFYQFLMGKWSHLCGGCLDAPSCDISWYLQVSPVLFVNSMNIIKYFQEIFWRLTLFLPPKPFWISSMALLLWISFWKGYVCGVTYCQATTPSLKDQRKVQQEHDNFNTWAMKGSSILQAKPCFDAEHVPAQPNLPKKSTFKW